MKITRVSTSSISYRRTVPAGRGCATQAWCIQVDADSGVSGIAVAAMDVSADVAQLANEWLIGADPRATTDLWQRMSTASAVRTGAIRIEAAAALDMALWDLRAKQLGEPLWKTLGGARPRINVHLGGCALALADDELERWCVSASEAFGFRAAKLEVDDVSNASRRLGIVQRSLRQRPGSPPTLLLDAGERWSAQDAVRNVGALEERFDVTWIESPTHRDDLGGLKHVADRIRGAVCGGAAGSGSNSYLAYLQQRCVNVVQIDTARVGITGALQIADAAFGFELPVALCASVGNANAHVASVMPYCASMEVVCPGECEGIATDVRIEDGWAIAGDRIGNGLLVDASSMRSAS